jgi:GNAT superfamily N-acetyltransferase
MDENSIRIREFESAFEAEVRELIQRVYREFGFGPDVTPESNPDLFDIARVYSGRGRFWMAMDGGRVIGTGALREKSAQLAEVKQMYIFPEYRGGGIGLALLEKVVGFAREQGYQRLELGTVARLQRAVKLYERYGFRKSGVDRYLTLYELHL